MKSHTVPRKLLEQFAYDNPVTRTKLLWRYEKGKPPYERANPKSATRWDGHFSHPDIAAKEAQLEQRLEREFEHPVNQFIDEMIGDDKFVLQPDHIKALTGYVRMLFTRSLARRQASEQQAQVTTRAFQSITLDEEQLAALIHNFRLVASNGGLDPNLVTRELIVSTIEQRIAARSDGLEPQRQYIQSVETMMDFADDKMLNGYWGIIRNRSTVPFVIGDAPVITWERTANNILYFGQGFARPDVEVCLPISPKAALHILPDVERTRAVRPPAGEEVNMGQAQFATQYVFTNIHSQKLDVHLQPHFGKVRIGTTGFVLHGIDFKKKAFDILMRTDPAID